MSDLFYNKGQFTVMIIVGRVERAVNSKAVNFRFQPKPAYLAVDYKTELKLDYYHGTTISVKGRVNNDKHYSIRCDLYCIDYTTKYSKKLFHYNILAFL